MGCGPSKQQIVVSYPPKETPSAANDAALSATHAATTSATNDATVTTPSAHIEAVPPVRIEPIIHEKESNTFSQETFNAAGLNSEGKVDIRAQESSFSAQKKLNAKISEKIALEELPVEELKNEASSSPEVELQNRSKPEDVQAHSFKGISDAAKVLGNIMHGSLHEVKSSSAKTTLATQADEFKSKESSGLEKDAPTEKHDDAVEVASKNLAQVLISGEKISLAVEPTIVSDRVITLSDTIKGPDNLSSANQVCASGVSGTKNEGKAAEFSNTLDTQVYDNISTITMRTEQNIPVHSPESRTAPKIHGAASERSLPNKFAPRYQSSESSQLGLSSTPSHLDKFSQDEQSRLKTPPNSIDVVSVASAPPGVDMRVVLEKITEIGLNETSANNSDLSQSVVKKTGAQSQTNVTEATEKELNPVSFTPPNTSLYKRFENPRGPNGLRAGLSIISTPSRLDGLDDGNSTAPCQTPANSVDFTAAAAATNKVNAIDINFALQKVSEIASESHVDSIPDPQIKAAQPKNMEDEDGFQSARDGSSNVFKEALTTDLPSATQVPLPHQSVDNVDQAAPKTAQLSNDPNKRLSQILMGRSLKSSLNKINAAQSSTKEKNNIQEIKANPETAKENVKGHEMTRLPDSETSIRSAHDSTDSAKFESAKASAVDVQLDTNSVQNTDARRPASSSPGSSSPRQITSLSRASSAAKSSETRRKS